MAGQASDLRLPVRVVQILPEAGDGKGILEPLENPASAGLARLQALGPVGACVSENKPLIVWTRNGPFVSQSKSREGKGKGEGGGAGEGQGEGAGEGAGAGEGQARPGRGRGRGQGRPSTAVTDPGERRRVLRRTGKPSFTLSPTPTGHHAWPCWEM